MLLAPAASTPELVFLETITYDDGWGKDVNSSFRVILKDGWECESCSLAAFAAKPLLILGSSSNSKQ